MDQVSQIREKIDIVALIQEFIPLKKAGSNFKTTCPFHNEKTPSFVVSPERQIWHCFGCNLGGDCYTFLMEYEKLEFIEALRILAKKTGIELTQRFDGGSSKKEKIYTLNKLAMDFYHFVLTHHNAGKKALSYLLDQRKISLPLIEAFKIGYAPGVGNALSTYLIQKKGYKKEDLFEAGIAVQKARVADFFMNRIIFPLFDHRDNTVGFSARLLDSGVNSFGSKYVNTRDTLVYHKGSLFFGLNIAKEEIKKKGKAIVVEGEFDVISSFMHGIKNVVAIKGTALTENQVKLLSRFCQKVSLCFDTDAAGQDAIKRSLPILEKHNFTTSIVPTTQGKDPDEALQKDPTAFKKALENDIGIYDFFLAKVLLRFDKKTAEGKKKIADELLPLFTNIDNEIIKEHYFRKLSTELDTSYESINKQAKKLATKQDDFIQQETKTKRDRKEILEEYLLSLIIQAENVHGALAKIAPIESNFSFSATAYQKIIERLLSFAKTHKSFDRNQFASSLPEELIKTFNTCFLFPLPQFISREHYLQEIENVANELKELSVRFNMQQIGEKIKEIEKNGKSGELQKLQEEFDSLIRLLQKP